MFDQLSSPQQQQPLYGTSPEALKQRRLYAAALMKQGMETTPIHHWSQGLGRVLQAGMGGYEQGQADREDRQGKSLATQNLLKSLQEYDGKDPSSIISAASDPNMPAGMGELIAKVLPQIGNRTVSGAGGAVSTPEAVPVINKDPSAAPAAMPPQSGGAAPTPVSQAPLPPPEVPRIGGTDPVAQRFPQAGALVTPSAMADKKGAFLAAALHGPNAQPQFPGPSSGITPRPVQTTSIQPPAAPPGIRPQDAATMHYLQNEGLNYKQRQDEQERKQKEALDVTTQLDQHKRAGIDAGDHLVNIEDILHRIKEDPSGTKGLIQAKASEMGVQLGKNADHAEATRALLKRELFSEGGLVNSMNQNSNQFRSLQRQIESITPATGQEAKADILHSIAGQYNAVKQRGLLAQNENQSPSDRMAAIGKVKPESPFGRLGYPEEKGQGEASHGGAAAAAPQASSGGWINIDGVKIRKKQ